MSKILRQKEAIKIAIGLKKEKKSVVLAGGCFDIIHDGHKKYLRESKSYGDSLFVLLESDANIKTKKGSNRPINEQAKRAYNLSLIPYVDYVVKLMEMTKDSDYDTLLSQISPGVITATIGDEELEHKKRQSKKLKSRLVLIKKLKNLSTTNILMKYGSTRNNSL